MQGRKFAAAVLTALCILAYLSAVESADVAEEFGDSAVNLAVARSIGDISGVNAAAVLSKGNDVLIGVTAEGRLQSDVEQEAARIAGRVFGDKSITVTAGGSASDVMELSYCLSKRMPRYITSLRFKRLLSQIRQAQGEKTKELIQF